MTIFDIHGCQKIVIDVSYTWHNYLPEPIPGREGGVCDSLGRVVYQVRLKNIIVGGILITWTLLMKAQ